MKVGREIHPVQLMLPALLPAHSIRIYAGSVNSTFHHKKGRKGSMKLRDARTRRYPGIGTLSGVSS